MKIQRNLCLIVLCSLFCLNLPAQGAMAVFDPTNWMTAIDSLYKTYDMINNQITTIQQNYERMQHALEQAKSFDFQNVQWDGDLDIRNEIANATAQVNSQLNNIRAVRNGFNNHNMVVNGHRYSLSDLCGFGESNGLGSYVNDVATEIARNKRKAAGALKHGVTQDEAAYIMAKYGLSPTNYYMVQDTKNLVQQKAAEIIGNAEMDITEVREIHEKKVKKVENIIKMLDHEGELTQKEIGQAQTYLMSETIQSLEDLKYQIGNAAAYQAYRDALQDQKEQAEKDSQASADLEAYQNNFDFRF